MLCVVTSFLVFSELKGVARAQHVFSELSEGCLWSVQLEQSGKCHHRRRTLQAPWGRYSGATKDRASSGERIALGVVGSHFHHMT